ncbi:F-box protein CPR1-like [Papaver somniferum]|uniref:F-box protein CPR1-like n=1 Tax=Papaver somniferum TaxID=3469 RepID=UPI000E6FABD6|nr:F-box protein CPR1-like [Papaver somniferum]
MDYPSKNRDESDYNYIVGSCNGLILLNSLDKETATSSWRKGQDIPPVDFGEFPDLLLNGALHWIDYLAGNTAACEKNYRAIISFAIENEKFIHLPFPEETMAFRKGSYSVEVLGDTLCLVCIVPYARVDVWVMQNYGVREYWTKLFTTTHVNIISYPNSLKFYDSVKNSEILTEVDKSFALYDRKKDSVRFVYINGVGDFYFSSDSYVESLVSINSGTYMGKEITDRTRRELKNTKVKHI